MKTIDLLVQELPALGGFPGGAVEAGFLCSDDTLYFVNKDGDLPLPAANIIAFNFLLLYNLSPLFYKIQYYPNCPL